MARRHDFQVPSYEAYRTARTKGGSVAEQLLEWCRSRPDHANALAILERNASEQKAPTRLPRSAKVINGYVYLMRYGKSGRDYKIGMSDDPPRRHAQISAMFPGELTVIHVIETDDPAGIERYWHERFAEKRVASKREIYRLISDDVAAFKRRKYQ